VLLGRGDGTFQRQTFLPTFVDGFSGNIGASVAIADVDGDGSADLVCAGALDRRTYVRLGSGDGVTFTNRVAAPGGGPGLAVADLNGDGKLDLVSANYYTNEVSYVFGNGNGTFSKKSVLFGGQSPVDVQVADIASLNPDGSSAHQTAYPTFSLSAPAPRRRRMQGPPSIMVSPGVLNERGVPTYGDGITLAGGTSPLGLALADLDSDGSREIAFVDIDGVHLIFDAPPDIPANTTQGNARDLGTIVHLLQPTLTIVPGREDAWYTMTAPREAAQGSGDEVVDFSGIFEHVRGAGLQMEVLDEQGNVLGAGEHVRIRAKQGQRLTVHVFGRINSDDRAAAARTRSTSRCCRRSCPSRAQSACMPPGVDARAKCRCSRVLS
jgi:hypothetical protein